MPSRGEHPKDVGDVGEYVADTECHPIAQRTVPRTDVVRDVVIQCGENPLGKNNPHHLVGDKGSQAAKAVLDELQRRMGVAILESLEDRWEVVVPDKMPSRSDEMEDSHGRKLRRKTKSLLGREAEQAWRC